MMRTNFSGHRGYACLYLENLGVLQVWYLDGRIGVYHVAILGVHVGAHLDYRRRDLSTVH